MEEEKDKLEVTKIELLKSIKKSLQIISGVLIISFLIYVFVLTKLFGATGIFNQ